MHTYMLVCVCMDVCVCVDEGGMYVWSAQPAWPAGLWVGPAFIVRIFLAIHTGVGSMTLYTSHRSHTSHQLQLPPATHKSHLHTTYLTYRPSFHLSYTCPLSLVHPTYRPSFHLCYTCPPCTSHIPNL